MSNDLIPYVDPSSDLQLARAPELVLEEARRAAVALKSVIDAKPKKVEMNGEVYLEYEDWQTMARFYGLTAKVSSTTYVRYGEAQGFEARAVALHVSGQEVSAAEAMCLNDEDKWSTRPKYEWHYVKKTGGLSKDDPGRDEIIWDGRKPKKKRVLVGEEPVPLFQLRSMAQTRACAKALRNALAWVVVLAGYKPTPAEELPASAITPNENNDPLKVDPITGEVYDDVRPERPEGCIDSKTITAFWKHAKKHKWLNTDVTTWLEGMAIKGVDYIQIGQVDDLMAKLQEGPPKADVL